MIWILLVVSVLILVVLKVAALNSDTKKKSKSTYHYEKKDSFMTAAENNFFQVLQSAVGEKYVIFAQVHLATILNHDVNQENSWGAFRHIAEKSVDFVLCEKGSLRPVAAIELNDRTHEKETRKLRDDEVNRIFEESKLSLITFSVQKQYSIKEITDALNVTLISDGKENTSEKIFTK